MSPSLLAPASELMSWPVATIDHECTLQEVIELLGAEEVGALVVTRQEHPIGMLSERDVVVHLARAADAAHLTAGEAMTTEVVSAPETITIVDAARLLASADIRHLPLTRDGAIVGIVSSRDVIDVLANQT
ncbi:CBS domain-containing protein [Nocardioides daeguensis]|uniref:CBS domain-containing protein n=1 Tax=Nocardioides daeguensis TaxID=908359 RepID=A0ABP6UQF8_9ACTN|nr:CBS domain-containing protein [Nocardioides daeguensis]MBV6728338.1 CBS domain-containing protein [Nocardioides daeguensis]MCR1773147.1 CBS domain-containing protein [Nocardioides daeguensis]